MTKAETKWKVTTAIAAIGLALVVTTNFAGLPSCAEYQTKAASRGQHDELRGYITALAERTEDTRDMIHMLGRTVGIIDTKLEERTRGQ